MADIMSLQESDQISLDLAYFCPIEYFLQRKYAMKGFYKEYTRQGLSVAILWINEVAASMSYIECFDVWGL